MKLIGQGAEAKLYRAGNKLIKHRVKKGYRVKELDLELRKTRTRREAKMLAKLARLSLNVPRLISFDDRKMEIIIEFIEGAKLSEELENLDYLEIMRLLARSVANLHNNDIVHGDLTTSNMILNESGLYLIDFGLAYHTTKIEDKAVDLHLLKQALQSKHSNISAVCFSAFKEEYSRFSKQSMEIFKRLEKVEKRGRYKH